VALASVVKIDTIKQRYGNRFSANEKLPTPKIVLSDDPSRVKGSLAVNYSSRSRTPVIPRAALVILERYLARESGVPPITAELVKSKSSSKPSKEMPLCRQKVGRTLHDSRALRPLRRAVDGPICAGSLQKS